ncbi:ATP-binding protein [Ferrimicrobium sp.]|uniref:ATP-binding protein n=1 Tax=Ferrimicrobium sp. TaxID=2926050 RepID=UPI002613941F|nr:ATP-binding protein [Ferrimicrobium sp.]
MRVVWYRPETILQMMATAKLTDTVTGTLGKLKRLDLVVIDDVGILPIDQDTSEALYRVIETAYEVTSPIVTSNFALSSFDQILTPASLASRTGGSTCPPCPPHRDQWRVHSSRASLGRKGGNATATLDRSLLA